MEPLTLFVIAYLVGKGLASGSNNVKKAHDTNKEKLSPKKDGDKAGKGTNIAAGVLTAGTAVYTFGSGFKHGWKEAWPEARQVVAAQRAKNRALKEAKAKGDAVPTGDGRPPLTEADSAGLVPPPRPGDPHRPPPRTAWSPHHRPTRPPSPARHPPGRSRLPLGAAL